MNIDLDTIQNIALIWLLMQHATLSIKLRGMKKI